MSVWGGQHEQRPEGRLYGHRKPKQAFFSIKIFTNYQNKVEVVSFWGPEAVECVGCLDLKYKSIQLMADISLSGDLFAFNSVRNNKLIYLCCFIKFYFYWKDLFMQNVIIKFMICSFNGSLMKVWNSLKLYLKKDKFSADFYL